MASVPNETSLFMLIGVAAAVWSLALTFFVVRSDLRQKSASLHMIATSFGILVMSLGENIRRSKV